MLSVLMGTKLGIDPKIVEMLSFLYLCTKFFLYLSASSGEHHKWVNSASKHQGITSD